MIGERNRKKDAAIAIIALKQQDPSVTSSRNYRDLHQISNVRILRRFHQLPVLGNVHSSELFLERLVFCRCKAKSSLEMHGRRQNIDIDEASRRLRTMKPMGSANVYLTVPISSQIHWLKTQRTGRLFDRDATLSFENHHVDSKRAKSK